jgi:hypothetical protein
MLVIADFANDDGEAWPSIDTLAYKAECTRRAVQKNIIILQSEGELQIRQNAGPRGCNLYRIIFKNIPLEDKIYDPKRVNHVHPRPTFTRERKDMGGEPSGPLGTPEPLGTVKEPSEERESAKAPRSPASNFSLDEYAPLIARLNHCRAGWEAAPVLNAKEIAALKANLPCLNAILPETWLVLKDYLAASMPEGSPAYQPRSRERFISAISDVVAYAVQWKAKQRPPAPKPQAKPVDEDPPLTIEETLAILKMKP